MLYWSQVISPGPWYNLRHQQYQPNSAHGPHGYLLSSVEKLLKVSWDRSDKKGIIKYHKNFDTRRFTSESEPRTSSEGIHDDSDSSYDNRQTLNIKESFIRFQEMPPSKEKVPEVITQVMEVAASVNTAADEIQDAKFSSSDSQTKQSGFKKIVHQLKAVFKKHKSNVENYSNEATTSANQEVVPSATSIDNTVEENIPEARTRESMVAISINLNLNTDEGKTRWALAHVPMEKQCLRLYLKDAFSGGACLKITPSDKISTEHRTTRLFHCDFKCYDTLIVCVVTKTLVQYANQSLNIKLTMKNAKGDDLKVILMGKNLGLSASLTRESVGFTYSYPLNSETQTQFQEVRQYLLLNQPGFYVPLENLYGWEVRFVRIMLT